MPTQLIASPSVSQDRNDLAEPIKKHGWVGVDLDGTAALYDHWRGPTHIGHPVPLMVERIKKWIREGQEVRIFTARVFPFFYRSDEEIDLDLVNENTLDQSEAALAIQSWCFKYVGQKLAITCAKDMSMIQLWDDRAVQVVQNAGIRADGLPTL